MSALQGTAPVTDALSTHDHVATRRIAGFTPRDLSVLVAFLLLTIWAIWATRELLELKERRIVSVIRHKKRPSAPSALTFAGGAKRRGGSGSLIKSFPADS